jgi:tetratricopeptide (TPR) repeat protein
MKINRSNLMQHKKLTATNTERVRMLCAQAKEREEAGEFEEARLALSEFWQRIGERPRLEGLAEPEQAELLLRAGALSGWIGSARQIPGAQETAKDLISESSAVFKRLGLMEKVVETRVDLGICYWREGAHDEARITFDDALRQLGDVVSEQRLRALLNKAVVEQACTRPKEALRLLSEAESLFEVSTNHSLKGKFHNVYATVLKYVGLAGQREDYFDRALMQFTAASLSFEKAGHKRFLAAVENNLGFLFVHLQRFDEAHEHLDRARSVLIGLNDKGLVAQVDDTRARAFLGQGRFDQAEMVAGAAVKVLREGDEQSILAGALTTHATTLARSGRHSEALAMLDDAIALAGQAGDAESGGIAALTIIEELTSVLSPADLRTYYKSAESALTHSQHAAIRVRVGACARIVLAAEDPHSLAIRSESNIAPSTANLKQGNGNPSMGRTQTPMPEMELTNRSLEEQVLLYEGRLIRQALEASDGSVTRAARMLGVTHQGLAFILNGRHKSLLAARKPVKRRRRSIIRFH